MLDYLRIDRNQFDIGEELSKLESIRRVKAWEGVVFYSARVFEKVFITFMETCFGEKESNLFGALNTMETFRMFPLSFLYFAHSLRRMGNQVRHIKSAKISGHEADSSIILLILLLRAMARLERNPSPESDLEAVERLFSDLRQGEAFSIYEGLAAQPIDHDRMWEAWERRELNAFSRSPTLAALYAEFLMHERRHRDRDLLERAVSVLETSLKMFSSEETLRLHQLLALLCKNRGETERAIQILTQRCQGEDVETIGMLASCRRKQWMETGRRDFLEKAYSLYDRHYRKSRSSYIGINLAATALYSGRPVVSREVAGELVDALNRNLARFSLKWQDLGDWDLASLAEGLLLAGSLRRSRLAYRLYFERVGHLPGMVGTTRDQLELNLRHLGMACSCGEFLEDLREGPEEFLKIGVSGHRTLPEDGRLADLLQQAHRRIRDGHPGRPLGFVTPLAEGADRIVPAVFGSFEGARLPLLVELPLEIHDYLQDFAAESSKQEFLCLLRGADEVRYSHPAQTREGAYLDVGRRVVDASDLMIFLWDGQPARGTGGTAEIVRYAVDKNHACIIINTSDFTMQVREKGGS